MTTYELIDMMFAYEPIENFEEIFKKRIPGLEWEELLTMCYMERNYLRAGGDEGYKKNPPICHNEIDYLTNLISFLETSGIVRKDKPDIL